MSHGTHSGSRLAVVLTAWLMLAAAPDARAAQAAPPVPAAPAGVLHVTFLYMPPTSIDPTYHTAIWLEDAGGRIVKTLYVSQELSSAEYKMGNACPDWVKKARWDAAPKSEVDAVTAPTPNVGSEAKAFDLGSLGVLPGVYQFMFQMHVGENHNVLFRGALTVGGPDQHPKLEMTQGPGTLVSTDQYVRDVQVRYIAAAGKVPEPGPARW